MSVQTMHRAKWNGSFSAGVSKGMLVLLAGASLVFAAGCDQKPGPAQPMGAFPVSVVTVQSSDVQLGNQWVGTLDGYVNAQIQPQVSGYLVKQEYREGSMVHKGQVLFQIDPRPFQASLDQAKGQVGQAQAALGQAQAALELAQINVRRDTPLAEQRAIAQSQLDTEKQTEAQAQANVRAAQAQIATAQAAQESAQLNLGFTQVRSLITGIAGQATTQVGNLVSPQSNLTSVSQLDPIKVYFSMGDAEYLALVNRTAAAAGDLLKNAANIPLTLTLANGDPYPYKGKIAFIDRQMNQQTGAIRIAAIFPNPGNVLRPGQFGRVSATTELRRNVILVPQLAVSDMQGQKQVYTVGADNKVHIANIELGSESGSDWIVTSGLQPGTRVITDNLQKLKDGMPVAPHAATVNAGAAPASPAAEK